MCRPPRPWILAGACLVGLAPHSFGQAPARFGTEAVREGVSRVAAVVGETYFDEDVGGRARAALLQRLEARGYDRAVDAPALAVLLTRDLYRVTRDKHLVVAAVRAPERKGPSDRSRTVGAPRAGVQRVEMLAGRIGYLNLTSFDHPDDSRDSLAAAMHLLAGADALIIDMRENAGGSPDAVALLCSYMFDRPSQPLFEIVPRNGSARRYATLDTVPDDSHATRPVFVLTSARTFSAGEGLAYLLQEQRRAAVIGETTAGAANPGRRYPATAWLEVTVPNGRVRTAVSGRNWEGTGVVPDIKVPAGDALLIARVRALRGLVATAPAGSRRDELQRHLRALQKSPARVG